MNRYTWASNRFALAALIVGSLSGIQFADAASFDCSMASAADEKAVCANPELSAMDSEMSGLWYGYKAMPLLMGASGNREDGARAFLTSRAACADDTACLTKLYEQRISALQKNIDWAVKHYFGSQ